MSIIGQTVENAGVKLFADLYGGAPAPGTNVIVYNLNAGQGLVTGSRNQNWRFIHVNTGRNQFNIQSVLTGLYASVASAAAGQQVVSSDTPFAWEVSVVDFWNPNSIIKVPNTNLVWNVPAGSGVLTNVTITTLVAGDLSQEWTLRNVQFP